MASASPKGTIRGKMQEVSLKRIRPPKWSKRALLAEDALKIEIGAIRKGKTCDPLMVRPLGKKSFEIITGEIRWMAAKQAGLRAIPCEVHRIDDTEARKLGLLDTLKQTDISPLEEADILAELIQDFGLRQSELAAMTGRSKTQVSRTIRISSLPKELKEKVRQSETGLTRAQLIEAAEHPQLAEWIIEERPTLREIRLRLSRQSASEYPKSTVHRSPHSSRSSSSSGVSYDEFEDGSGLRLKVHYDQKNCTFDQKEEIVHTLKVALFILGEMDLDNTITDRRNTHSAI